jgi:hypothetical protein
MLCVYGVVRCTHPGVEVAGVQSRPTMTVRCGDLAAIVSETSDELLARRRDVEAHLDVLEQALANGDVLPFRFGTVVDDVPAMCHVLEQSASRYHDLLARVGGRVQMTVKVVRDDDESVRAVVTGDADLRHLVAHRRGSASWADRVALGERVAAAVDRLNAQDMAFITTRLATAAEGIDVTPAPPPGIASIALLARPGQLIELDNAVASLHDALGHRTRFEYAGPMPPYSFVS